MLHIAICDDYNPICIYLTNFIKANFPDKRYKIHDFSNGAELLQEIEESNNIYNLIFLDLKMDGGNGDGIPTGSTLRKIPSHKNSLIFFITSYDANPVPLVDIHPFAYIKKPIDNNILYDKLADAFQLLDTDTNFVLIPKANDGIRINTSNILYLRTQHRKCGIHLESEVINCNRTLTQVLNIIEPINPLFVQTHISYVVNLKYLKYIYRDYLVLTNDVKIPISRSFHDDVLLKYRQLIPTIGRLQK